MKGTTHLDGSGNLRMVDVSLKDRSLRTAAAGGELRFPGGIPAVLLGDGESPKGNILVTAEIAGIQSVKRTHELIPLCHPLDVGFAGISFEAGEKGLTAVCTVRGSAATGFEMEALTGVAVALLAVYDMVKSLCTDMEISGVHLISKSGGSSGEWRNGT